jgi:hypothetical protein
VPKYIEIAKKTKYKQTNKNPAEKIMCKVLTNYVQRLDSIREIVTNNNNRKTFMVRISNQGILHDIN